MPSSRMTSVCAGFCMSIAKRAFVNASVFHDASKASNWQWSNAGGASAKTCVCAASASPPGATRARRYIMSLSSTACTSPRASAASASTSPNAVSPCLPRSTSKAVTLPGFMSSSASHCSGTMWPCGESVAPVAMLLPAKSATFTMPASSRTTTTVAKSQSVSRMPSEMAPGESSCVSTCANGPFHAMSIPPLSRAPTCAS
mmetsp:Transcript_7411/g.27121  ORF Transcript_7411/g.27121 Transcript_7411/m.27121 type:complete len:201 (+) Transcript_7411:1665-2267(+)